MEVVKSPLLYLQVSSSSDQEPSSLQVISIPDFLLILRVLKQISSAMAMNLVEWLRRRNLPPRYSLDAISDGSPQSTAIMEWVLSFFYRSIVSSLTFTHRLDSNPQTVFGAIECVIDAFKHEARVASIYHFAAEHWFL